MAKHAQLVKQPTAAPTRKIRWGAYALAALTIGSYVVSAVTGEGSPLPENALGDAIEVLLSGLLPLIAAYAVKEEVKPADKVLHRGEVGQANLGTVVTVLLIILLVIVIARMI